MKMSLKARRRTLVIAEFVSGLMMFVCIAVMISFRMHDWGLPMWLAIAVFFVSLFGIGFFYSLADEAHDLIKKHDKEMEMVEYRKHLRRKYNV